MKRWVPWALASAVCGVGSVTTAAGFLYLALYVGVPYQDATPEQEAEQMAHDRVGTAVILAGLPVGLIGFIGLGVLSLRVIIRRPDPDR